MSVTVVQQPSVLSQGPCSVIQEGIWIEESIGRAGSAYKEGLALRVSGALNIERLQWAFNQLISRHPALRTRFLPGPDGLEQQVVEHEAAQLVAERMPAEAVPDWLQRQLAQPFDLASAPLHRVSVAEIGERRYVIAVIAHHLIVDGWSLGNFQLELSLLYTTGSTQSLPPLTTTPIEYAQAQRQWCQSAERDAAAQYWTEKLSNLEVSLDGPGGGGTTTPFNVDAKTYDAVKARARSLSVSPFAVFFAAFATAMEIATGRKDLGLATDFSSRTDPGYEPLIAMLVNQLPLRWDGAAVSSASERIQAAHMLNLEALQHAKMPYPMIAEATNLANKQLFEAKFVLHNTPRKPFELDSLRIEAAHIDAPDAKFPALLELWESELGLSGSAAVDLQRSRLDAGELVQLFNSQLVSLIDEEDLVHRVAHKQSTNTFKPKRRQISAEENAVTIIPSGKAPFPVIVEANSADLDLAVWLDGARSRVRSCLNTTGSVLLRGFEVGTAQKFKALAQVFDGEPLAYSERSTPRKQIDSGVYTSTEYPADQEIFFHNENAYAASWPTYLLFWCETPASEGGRTPLADTRRVFAELPAEIREAFSRHGVFYRRKFRAGLGLSWQEAFGVDDLDSLKEKFQPQGYRFGQDSDGTLFADFLTPATVAHPVTGDMSWFNHAAIFHSSALADMVGDSGVDVDMADYSAVGVMLGNGDEIPKEWIEKIRQAYRDAAVEFAWQRDDVLLVDNRITAHARGPFSPPRRVLVAMTGAQNHASLDI